MTLPHQIRFYIVIKFHIEDMEIPYKIQQRNIDDKLCFCDFPVMIKTSPFRLKEKKIIKIMHKISLSILHSHYISSLLLLLLFIGLFHSLLLCFFSSFSLINSILSAGLVKRCRSLFLFRHIYSAILLFIRFEIRYQI